MEKGCHGIWDCAIREYRCRIVTSCHSLSLVRSVCGLCIGWGKVFRAVSWMIIFYDKFIFPRTKNYRERERKKRRNVAMLYGDFSIRGFESANGHRKTWSFHLIRGKKRRWHHGTGIYITNLRVKSQQMVVIVHICIFHIITNRCVFSPAAFGPSRRRFGKMFQFVGVCKYWL